MLSCRYPIDFRDIVWILKLSLLAIHEILVLQKNVVNEMYSERAGKLVKIVKLWQFWGM